jgi:TonB family protein
MKKVLLSLLMSFLLVCMTTVPTQAQDSIVVKKKVYYGIEHMPEYPGGEDAMLAFIKKNLKYPAVAAEQRVEGRVTIRFVINAEGDVTDVNVLRSLSKECDDEAVRVVKLMPRWIQGTQYGKAVPVYFTLPVVFKLKKENYGKASIRYGNGTNALPPSQSTVSKDPLVLMDGKPKPYSILKDTLFLNPANIEKMVVLKDPAAIAVWGSKGANGVILISTKAGKANVDSLNHQKP